MDVNLLETPGLQQENFMKECLNCFDAKSFKEGKYAFLEASGDRVETLLKCSVGWLENYLSSTSEIDKRNVLYLTGNENERDRVIESFKKTSRLREDSLVEMIVLDSPEKMQIFKGEREFSKPVPTVIFSTHKFFFSELTGKFLPKKSPTDQEKKISLKDTLVIVDDAHVLEQSARDAASRKVSECEMEAICTELEKGPLSENMRAFKTFFKDMQAHNGEDYLPMHYSAQQLKTSFNSFYQLLLEKNEHLDSVSDNAVFQLICHVYQFAEHELDSLQLFASHKYTKCCEGSCKELHIICLDPSVIIQRLRECEPHCLIFTSATISPFDQFKAEIGIEEGREYTSQPDIKDYQVFARILSCGAGGYFLNSSQQCRYELWPYKN